jgi:hypothetical protein
MAATFTARSNPMTMDGDETQQRRRKSSFGLKRVQTHLDKENERIEEHDREDGHAKVTVVDPHHDLIARVDSAEAAVALLRVNAKLPRKKWLCFVACEFGMVEDRRGILRIHRALIPDLLAGKERTLSFEEVGRYYDVAADTAKQYDADGRREYQLAYDAVLHEPKRSRWWGEEWGEMDAGRTPITRNHDEAMRIEAALKRKGRA